MTNEEKKTIFDLLETKRINQRVFLDADDYETAERYDYEICGILCVMSKLDLFDDYFHFLTEGEKYGMETGYDGAIDFLDEMPSADVVEVKHGEWKPEKTRFGFYCNKCKMYSYWQTNFCPNCGADMRGEKNV